MQCAPFSKIRLLIFYEVKRFEFTPGNLNVSRFFIEQCRGRQLPTPTLLFHIPSIARRDY